MTVTFARHGNRGIEIQECDGPSCKALCVIPDVFASVEHPHAPRPTDTYLPTVEGVAKLRTVYLALGGAPEHLAELERWSTVPVGAA